MHGFAFNLNTNLEHLSGLIPVVFLIKGHFIKTVNRKKQSRLKVKNHRSDYRSTFSHYLSKTFTWRIWTYISQRELSWWPEKPDWLKVPYSRNQVHDKVFSLIRHLSLHTVCEEANCPNRGECYSNETATFLLLGDRLYQQCTSACY